MIITVSIISLLVLLLFGATIVNSIMTALQLHSSAHLDIYSAQTDTELNLPLFEGVRAGFPSPAEEELRDVISFDEYLVSHPETSFLLSVTGDSMIGAGIMEKDLVIVERGRQPKNGDIILAEVDGNWTMKYLRKKEKTITLEAANPKYPPIVPQTELRIAGVITALVRKYHN